MYLIMWHNTEFYSQKGAGEFAQVSQELLHISVLVLDLSDVYYIYFSRIVTGLVYVCKINIDIRER